MLGIVLLLLGLWSALLGDAPTPVVPPVATSAPVSAFFQANVAALVHTDTYRRDRHQVAPCGRSGIG